MIKRTTALVIVLNLLILPLKGDNPIASGNRLFDHIKTWLSEMEATNYQAKTEIDIKAKTLKCDCSGLICFALRNYFPEAYLALDGKESPWRTRPLSVTYYETFVSAGQNPGTKPWKRIRKIANLKPGDLMAWRKTEIKKGVSTGHTMMVAQHPVKEPDGRYRIRVIDSTNVPHANDTRNEGQLGVGSGDMWFTVDQNDEPTGFYVHEKSKLNDRRPLAMGRLAAIQSNSISSEFINLPKDDAIDRAKEKKLSYRIIEEDGKVNPVKLRIDRTRINFILKDSIVIRVVKG